MVGNKERVGMRSVSLFAGAIQLLFGIFVVAPQVFGTEFFAASGQTAFRAFMVVGCLVLAMFFFGIAKTPAPGVGGGVGIASIVAAMALIAENLPSAFGTIRSVAAAASESWLWKYHPLRQCARELGLAIPMLDEIALVVFLLVVFARSLRAQDRKRGLESGTGFLKLASFAVAAVFVLALVGTFSVVILAPRPLTLPVVHLLLRLVTLTSCIAFFVVFGVNQRRQNN
jgi:hypothetical protein